MSPMIRTAPVIQEQVEMGVAVRMAVMDLLARNIPNSQAGAA